jgi:phosphoenolpyruvate carboxylase
MKTTKKDLQDRVKQLEEQLSEARERNAGFNKYKFVEDLQTEIKAQIESGDIEDEDGIREYIDSDIDNAVIYYKRAFEIAMELNATHFEDDNFGMPKDISQHAYFALYEYVYNEIDMSGLNELIEEKQNA